MIGSIIVFVIMMLFVGCIAAMKLYISMPPISPILR